MALRFRESDYDKIKAKAEKTEMNFTEFVTTSALNKKIVKVERVIFKLAVELAMTMNIVASDRNLSESFLRELRKNCREEVKEVHGDFTFNDAYDWQNNR